MPSIRKAAAANAHTTPGVGETRRIASDQNGRRPRDGLDDSPPPEPAVPGARNHGCGASHATYLRGLGFTVKRADRGPRQGRRMYHSTGAASVPRATINWRNAA